MWPVPPGEPIAGLVVVQEIFGVNAHIRSVADGYARDGFLAVAPALFDRIQPGVELAYEGADMQTAMSFIPKLDIEKALCRCRGRGRVCCAANRQESRRHRLLLWGNACLAGRVPAPSRAAVGYYGGRIGNMPARSPRTR